MGPLQTTRKQFVASAKRACDASDSCALQSFSPEVALADGEIRAAYEGVLLQVVDAVAQGLEGGALAERRKRAWALLSILSGGVTFARAVENPQVSERIAKSVRGAALLAVRGSST